MLEIPRNIKEAAEKYLETDLKLVGEAYWKSPLKAKMDKKLASCLAIPAAFTTLVSASAVWLEDREYPFYSAPRYHPDGIFYQTKVRSMYKYADTENEKLYSNRCARDVRLEGDPRRTNVGRIIRKFSFDELPQVFDVLKGKYAFIGGRLVSPSVWNREIRPYQNEEPYSCFINNLKNGAPFGIIGLREVLGRDSLRMLEKVHLDNMYFEKANAKADFRIAVAGIVSALKITGN